MTELLRLAMRINNSQGAGWGRRIRTRPEKGVIKKGSSTDIVLGVIACAHPRAITHAEIRDKCDCSKKSISWALHYLQSLNRIGAKSANDKRSENYLRYYLVVDNG